MHVRKRGPAQRKHFSGRVELHRAASERNHAVVQRNVAALQLLDVAHHFGFAAVAVKDGVRQNRVGAQMLQTLSTVGKGGDLGAQSLCQSGHKGVGVVAVHYLVGADLHTLIGVSEVDSVRLSRFL